MIRLILPGHLRALANGGGEIELHIAGQATQSSVLGALEEYPVLRDTIRDHVSRRRRPRLRFFACEQDLFRELPDALSPHAVTSGRRPFWPEPPLQAASGKRCCGISTGTGSIDLLALGVPCDCFSG